MDLVLPLFDGLQGAPQIHVDEVVGIRHLQACQVLVELVQQQVGDSFLLLRIVDSRRHHVRVNPRTDPDAEAEEPHRFVAGLEPVIAVGRGIGTDGPTAWMSAS